MIKLKQIKEEVRQKMVKNNIHQLDMFATGHNLIIVIESQDWGRLNKKLYQFANSYNNAVDELNQQYERINTLTTLLDEAASLVGNPCTNISSSTDIACMEWQEKYNLFKGEKK